MNNNSMDMFLFAFARKYILAFGWICSFIVIGVISFWSSVNPLWAVCWCAFGIIALNIHTKPQRRYYAPFFMTLFYFFGYLLSLVYVVMQKNSFELNDRYAYLLLENLGHSDLLRLTLVLAAGIAGLVCTTFVAEQVKKRAINYSFIPTWDCSNNFSWKKTSILIWIWLAGSVSLLLYMWVLGIGRGSLANQTTLPFRLAGIMVYTRGFLIPFIGIVFMEICLLKGEKKLVWRILFSLIFLGALGSVTSMSRSYFFNTVIPPLFYLILKVGKNKQDQRILVLSVLSCFFGAILIITLVQGLRESGLSGDRVSLSQLNTTGQGYKLTEGATTLIALAVTRIVGLQELLRVYNASINDSYAPWVEFWGSDKLYQDYLLLQVTGRTFESFDGYGSFGYGYGLWGQWFLSDSFLLVFLASFVFSLLIVFVEEIFLRKEYHICALYLSLTLSLWTWGGVYMFFLKRAIVMVIACYFIMMQLRKWSNLRSKTVTLSCVG